MMENRCEFCGKTATVKWVEFYRLMDKIQGRHDSGQTGDVSMRCNNHSHPKPSRNTMRNTKWVMGSWGK